MESSWHLLILAWISYFDGVVEWSFSNSVILICIYWLTFIYKEDLFLINRDQLLNSS